MTTVSSLYACPYCGHHPVTVTSAVTAATAKVTGLEWPTQEERGTTMGDLLHEALDIAEQHPSDRAQGRVRLTLRNDRGAVEGRVGGLTDETVMVDDGSDFPIWVRIDAIDTFRYA